MMVKLVNQAASKLCETILTPSCRHYDLIFKKIFLLAEYAKTDKVNVFWVLKFDWQIWDGFYIFVPNSGQSPFSHQFFEAQLNIM